MGSVKQTETGAFLNLDPARSKAILNAVGEEIKKLENMGKTPIIMTSPIVRMYFKRLTGRLLSGSGRSVLQRSGIKCRIAICGYGHSIRGRVNRHRNEEQYDHQEIHGENGSRSYRSCEKRTWKRSRDHECP